MIKGLVSEKARNWETISTSGGGLTESFSNTLRGVASKNFSAASPRAPVSFQVVTQEKRRSPTFVLSSFKMS